MAGSQSWRESGHEAILRELWPSVSAKATSVREAAREIAPQLTGKTKRTVRAVRFKIMAMIDNGELEPVGPAVSEDDIAEAEAEYHRRLASVRVKGDGQVELTSTKQPDIRNPEELIEACEVDMDVHEYVDGNVKTSQMGAKLVDWDAATSIMARLEVGDISLADAMKAVRGTTKIEKKTLYHCHVKLRRRASREVLSVVADTLLKDFEERRAELAQVAPPKVPEDGLLAFPCLVDVHLGKLSWHPETGVDYDLRRGRAAHRWAAEELIRKCLVHPVKQWLLFAGQDYFHFETETGGTQTTKGTQVEHDSRFAKVYASGVDEYIWLVEELLQYAPVHILRVPGNHARHAEMTLGVWLERYFAENPAVTFDDGHGARKYFSWGKTLLIGTHGDLEKVDLHQVVSSERPDLWGQSNWREVLRGHEHHRKGGRTPRKRPLDYQELQGLLVRTLPSLSARDFYHAAAGWTGAVRAAEAYLYSERYGLAETAHANILPHEWAAGLEEPPAA